MAKTVKRSPERRYHLLEASVEGVADRWRKQYPEDGRVLVRGQKSKDIQDALDALPVDAPPSKAAKIIGNQGWTHPFCTCCSQYVENAIEFGDDYPVAICVPCLEFGLNELLRASP